MRARGRGRGRRGSPGVVVERPSPSGRRRASPLPFSRRQRRRRNPTRPFVRRGTNVPLVGPGACFGGSKTPKRRGGYARGTTQRRTAQGRGLRLSWRCRSLKPLGRRASRSPLRVPEKGHRRGRGPAGRAFRPQRGRGSQVLLAPGCHGRGEASRGWRGRFKRPFLFWEPRRRREQVAPIGPFGARGRASD